MKLEDLRKEFKTISSYEVVICKRKKKDRQIFQRLELLGDKILGFILASIIYDKYKNLSEGRMSRILANLSSGKILSDISSDISIDYYLKKKKINFSEKVLADTIEAIIGAFFVKNGFDKTKKLIHDLWKKKINNINKIKLDNKTALQEWSQSKKLGLPEYKQIRKSGPDHGPSFTVRVKVKEYKEEIGKGKNVRDAEQDAAKTFLSKHRK